MEDVGHGVREDARAGREALGVAQLVPVDGEAEAGPGRLGLAVVLVAQHGQWFALLFGDACAAELAALVALGDVLRVTEVAPDARLVAAGERILDVRRPLDRGRRHLRDALHGALN